MITLRYAGLMSIAMLSSVACDDQTTEPLPAELIIVQAPSMVGAPGWELIDTLVVRAVDPSGTPRAGVAMTWSIRQGGGSIAPTGVTTDADGYAKAVWTLGATSGVNQVRASIPEGEPIDFESTGEAFRVDQLAAAGGMGCGLANGELRCWGLSFWANAEPVSNNLDFGWWNVSPGLVDDTRNYIELAVSASGSIFEAVCALDVSAAIWCSNGVPPAPTQVSGLPPVRGIVSATVSPGFCALAVSDSTAWCWQVGGMPQQVSATLQFTSLAMEGTYIIGSSGFRVGVCGTLTDSTAACWGPGPLGDGTVTPSETPVLVAGGHKFVQLAVGSGFACGRSSLDEVWCWGHAETGPDVLVPASVATGVSQIAAQENYGFFLGPTGVSRGRGAALEPRDNPVGRSARQRPVSSILAESCRGPGQPSRSPPSRACTPHPAMMALPPRRTHASGSSEPAAETNSTGNADARISPPAAKTKLRPSKA